MGAATLSVLIIIPELCLYYHMHRMIAVEPSDVSLSQL